MAALEQAELWALKDVEAQLVETGAAPQASIAYEAVAGLITAGLLVIANGGRLGLTRLGWRAAHALRIHLAANREQMAATNGLIPAFETPEDPAEVAEVARMAADIFVRRVAVDPLATADDALERARSFRARLMSQTLAAPGRE